MQIAMPQMTVTSPHGRSPRIWWVACTAILATTGVGLCLYVRHWESERRLVEAKIRAKQGFVAGDLYNVILPPKMRRATSLDLLCELRRVGCPEHLKLAECDVDEEMMAVIGTMRSLRSLLTDALIFAYFQ